MISTLGKFVKEWFFENIILITMMTVIFFGLQLFHQQERKAIETLTKKSELIKLKISLMLETNND